MHRVRGSIVFRNRRCVEKGKPLLLVDDDADFRFSASVVLKMGGIRSERSREWNVDTGETTGRAEQGGRCFPCSSRTSYSLPSIPTPSIPTGKWLAGTFVDVQGGDAELASATATTHKGGK